MPEYLSTDPNAGLAPTPSPKYLSTDPNAGLSAAPLGETATASPAPTAAPAAAPKYLSTDPGAGQTPGAVPSPLEDSQARIQDQVDQAQQPPPDDVAPESAAALNEPLPEQPLRDLSLPQVERMPPLEPFREDVAARMTPEHLTSLGIPDLISDEDAAKAMEVLNRIGVNKGDNETAVGVVQGGANAPVHAVNFALSPAGALTTGLGASVPILGKLIAMGFTLDSLRHVFSAPNAAARTEAILGTLLGGLGVAHSFAGKATPKGEPNAIQEPGTSSEIPRVAETGQNISEGGGGIRQGEQGAAPAGTSAEPAAQNPTATESGATKKVVYSSPEFQSWSETAAKLRADYDATEPFSAERAAARRAMRAHDETRPRGYEYNPEDPLEMVQNAPNQYDTIGQGPLRGGVWDGDWFTAEDGRTLRRVKTPDGRISYVDKTTLRPHEMEALDANSAAEGGAAAPVTGKWQSTPWDELSPEQQKSAQEQYARDTGDEPRFAHVADWYVNENTGEVRASHPDSISAEPTPPAETGGAAQKVVNPASQIVPKGNAGYELLDDERLGLRQPPKDIEIIPRGNLPEGTITTSIGESHHGNRPSSYAFTPDGRVYEDSNRMYTHGGMSPWVLRYVTKWFGEEPIRSEPIPESADANSAPVEAQPSVSAPIPESSQPISAAAERVTEDPIVSKIANRFTEERMASGELGPVEPGTGATKGESLARGLKMTPEEVAQQISDIMNDRGDNKIAQFDAVRAEEARLSELNRKASIAAREKPTAANKAAEDEAFNNLTDFHNGPVAKLKNRWHEEGMALQGSLPVDLGTYNGLREAWLRDNKGEPPPPEMEKPMRNTAKRVSTAAEKTAQAAAELNDRIEKASRARKYRTAEQTRDRFIEKMKNVPCR